MEGIQGEGRRGKKRRRKKKTSLREGEICNRGKEEEIGKRRAR